MQLVPLHLELVRKRMKLIDRGHDTRLAAVGKHS
jgi:hypothetical protein